MTKREIAEIRKQFSSTNCCISRIAGCFVRNDKERIAQFQEAFLSLPEEDCLKYFELFRKGISGKIGKTLHNLEFPLQAEAAGGEQEFLCRLRDSELKDEDLLNEFYDKVAEFYEYDGSYLILLMSAAYDVPGKTEDHPDTDDTSEEVYRHILCCICPMDLAKPSLSYDERQRKIQNRRQDWLVGMPAHAFLFPAFHERSTDLHAMLYYTKREKDLQAAFAERMFGCEIPMTAEGQKEVFQKLVEELMPGGMNYRAAKDLTSSLAELAEEGKDFGEPELLDSAKMQELLSIDEADSKKLAVFKQSCLDELDPANLVNEAKIGIASGPVSISLPPEAVSSTDVRTIDGKRCIVIETQGDVFLNGIRISRES